jgi:hypothetical protein
MRKRPPSQSKLVPEIVKVEQGKFEEEVLRLGKAVRASDRKFPGN